MTVSPLSRTSASRPSSTVWMLWSSLQRRSRRRLSEHVPHPSVKTTMTSLGCPPLKSLVSLFCIWKRLHEYTGRGIYTHKCYPAYLSVSQSQTLNSFWIYACIFCFFRFWDRGPEHSCMARRRNRSPHEARAASGEKGKKMFYDTVYAENKKLI